MIGFRNFKLVVVTVLAISTSILTSCSSNNDQNIAESTELLMHKSYTDIHFEYEVVSNYELTIKRLCKGNKTLMFTATNKERINKTLVVCKPSNKIHTISEQLSKN